MVNWYTESEQAEFKGELIPSITPEEQERRVRLFKIALWHADLQKKVFIDLASGRAESEGHTLEDAWWQAIK